MLAAPLPPAQLRKAYNLTITMMKHKRRLLLTNAFGLKSKLIELQHTAKTRCADIIIVTETKFSPEKISDSEVSLPGYAPPIRCDRNENGGGVAVWIKSDLAFQQLQQLNCLHHEIIWLLVTARDKSKLVLCAVYRPGSCAGSDTELLEFLDPELISASLHGDKLVVAGDFNVHSEEWLGSNKTTRAGELTQELCSFHGLEQHVVTPTRGKHILDLIMSDFDSTVNIKCLAPLGASDHAVILADLPICPYKEPNTSRVVWRYNQADWGRLRAFFRDFDWSSAITDSPEQSCTNITSTIQSGMQRFIPSRKLLSRPTHPAWWTPECTEAASVKQHAWRRFDKAATEENRVNAKIATEACKSVLKTAKDARLRTLAASYPPEICLTARGGPQSGRRVVDAETPLSLLLRANLAQSTPLMTKKRNVLESSLPQNAVLGLQTSRTIFLRTISHMSSPVRWTSCRQSISAAFMSEKSFVG